MAYLFKKLYNYRLIKLKKGERVKIKKLLLIVFIFSLVFGENFKIDEKNKQREILEKNKFLSIIEKTDDKIKRLKLLKEECNKNNAFICNVLGEYYVSSDEKNLSLGEKYLKKSCDLNSEIGCYNLIFFEMHYKQKKDSELKDLALKTCNIGYRAKYAGNACLHSGVLYLKNNETKKGLPYIKKACYLKNPKACYILGLLYNKGDYNVKKDENIAKNYLKRACDLGEKRACYMELKIYLDEGQKIRHNKRMRTIIKKLCDDFNDAEICFQYAIIRMDDIFEKTKKKKVVLPKEIVHYIKKSCILGNKKACDFLEKFSK